MTLREADMEDGPSLRVLCVVFVMAFLRPSDQ